MRHRPVQGDLGTDDRALAAEAAAAGVLDEPDGVEALIEVLADQGVMVPIGAVAELEAVFEEQVNRRAGEAIRRIGLRLEGSAAAVALRRVLAGTEGESLREAAVGAGCSHVAIWKLERKIKRRLTGG